MRAYFEIDEKRVGTHGTARFPVVFEMDRGEVPPSVHEFRVGYDRDRFGANWAPIVARDRSRPEQPRYTVFVKVNRVVQKLDGLRVATENAFFLTEAITTEAAVAPRPGLGGAS
jgi:hypothetical protein